MLLGQVPDDPPNLQPRERRRATATPFDGLFLDDVGGQAVGKGRPDQSGGFVVTSTLGRPWRGLHVVGSDAELPDPVSR